MKSRNIYYQVTALPLFLVCGILGAAPPDRISGPVESQKIKPVGTAVHRLAQPQYDQGAVDPSFRMDYITLMVKPSAAQQSELNQLLADQQTPSSKQFYQWLTPEEFGNRFGLSPSDHSKLVAWLQSEGFTVHESARARNWIAFGGTAGQVQRALHTSIHRYRVDGEMHFANASEPAVPAALAGVVGGFVGLHDFKPKSFLQTVKPDNTSPNGTHTLAPEDWATIYDVAPLYAAGVDGTGVNIGIIGFATLTLSDIQTFRSQYNLPPKDPKTVLVGANPGVSPGNLTEADLDIEWAGAIAPNATIYYYYGVNYVNDIASAVNANVVQVISMSFGYSEFDDPTLTFQPVFQQANAQGITLLASTGDFGAATAPDSPSNADRGPVVSTPASFPEVTAVGGTQFSEGTTPSTYWAATNSPNGGSALSYIPEIAWGGGGGGASAVFSKPAWQAGPGVPADGARDLPDVSLSASTHDGYFIVSAGSTIAGIGGTSASSPSMAGVVALLNHYLVANGNLTKPGLGNINPQLYRLAQSAPSAFHDITAGSNGVTCEQASPGCITGTFGYAAGPGYDLATGIGSIDVNSFVTSWNTATNAVNVTLSATPAQGTFNDTIQLTATVLPASGAGTPTGTVDFSSSLPLGSATLAATSGGATAVLNLPVYVLGATGTFVITAQYRGDAAFSGGGATTSVKVSAPTGVSSIVPSAPATVAARQDVTGTFWQFSVTLRERGGVAAVLAGFTIDGQSQPLAQYFPAVSIPANSSITSELILLRNIAYPQAHTLGFSGVDATGQNWSRQVSITFLGPADADQVLMTAVPLTVQQNPGAACQWPQQVILSEVGGFAETVIAVSMGNISLSDQIIPIFGTDRLAAYRSLVGNICWSSATPGGNDTLKVTFASGISQTLTVSFAGPAVNPSPVSVSPTTVTLSTADPAAPAQFSLAVTAPDGQSWTASVFPQNRFTSWLSLSQNTGSGSAQIALQANGTGFENGVYLATVVIQGPNMSPPVISVPVMFVYGNSSAMTISSFSNSASGQSKAAPGMTATIMGTAMANTTVRPTVASLSFTAANGAVSRVTVNGVPAGFKLLSPTQIDFQIPYETGTGPAVVGVYNGSSIGGFLFQVAPAAPGIFADANGNVTPTATVQAGKALTITITGDGEVTPGNLSDGGTPASNSSLFWKPALPFTLTIGGTPVFLTSYGIASGTVGVTTINCVVPASVPAGPQAVVVTVNGVSSPPVNVNVTAAP